MIGLLKEKNEIEKLQQEYKKIAKTDFIFGVNVISEIPEKELVREKCES